MSSTKIGENGHSEYGWSEDTREKLVQLAFQLTRTSEKSQHDHIRTIYRELLQTIFDSDNADDIYAVLALPLLTRDIIAGKGEYELYYILVGELSMFSDKINSTKINSTLHLLITGCVDLGTEHPYGSWKDMKYLLNYLRKLYGESRLIQKPIFNHIVTLVCDQLREDATAGANVSLCAKWAPREKSSKFGWQTRYFAIYYFNQFYDGSDLSERKCLTHFRKLVARLNTQLKTPQINQCNKTWNEIDFDKSVTSMTMARQKHAFLNEDKNGVLRPPCVDRSLCRANYLDYIDRCKSGASTIKAGRVGIVDMVREAMRLYNSDPPAECDTLNLQWASAAESHTTLDNLVAMVDTSFSMCAENSNPLYAAVGLGIRIAERSKLGRRIMTFSRTPTWIDLDEGATLPETVGKIASDGSWHASTNFEAALRLLLRSCIEKDLHPDEVKSMVLVVFSDMAIDEADGDALSMNELVKKLFYDAGMFTSHHHPYEPCRILYWNLRSTNGFPCLSTDKNVSMLSGYSPAMLNKFCTKGIDALDEFTPYSILWEQLNHTRYQWMRAHLRAQKH
jgi:hypothetical protein